MVVVYSANGYGPGDSLDPAHAHVIPSLIMKCFRDKELVVWGDGSPTRDFLYVDDIAEGLLLACEKLSPPMCVNIGSQKEISVKSLVETIARLTEFDGKIIFDISKGSGDARKIANVNLAKQELSFSASVSFEDGIGRTVNWYRERLEI